MFLAASPRAASQLGDIHEAARQMVEGKPVDKHALTWPMVALCFLVKNAMGNVNRLNCKG